MDKICQGQRVKVPSGPDSTYMGKVLAIQMSADAVEDNEERPYNMPDLQWTAGPIKALHSISISTSTSQLLIEMDNKTLFRQFHTDISPAVEC